LKIVNLYNSKLQQFNILLRELWKIVNVGSWVMGVGSWDNNHSL
jgi:hypothetical protein